MDNTRKALRMNPSVFLLIVLLQLTESSQNCSTLEVFDSEGKKENVSCRQYEGSACHNGPRAGFPDNLSGGHSVAKPREFQATTIRPNTTANENMGLKFQWKVPIDSASRANLKGFYLKMQLVGSGQVICRLFDLRDFNMTSSKGDASLHFSYELSPVTTFGNYVVDLFSLPPPTDEEHDAGLSQSLVVSVQLPRNTRSNMVTPPVKTSEGLLQRTEGSRNCSTLEVFVGNEKKENVSCIQYEDSACHNGPTTFPDNLSDGGSVAKPRDFQATPFRRNINTTANENMGLKFEWGVPTAMTSRANIKGFYLKMQPTGSGQVICRLFDLRGFNMTTSVTLKFSYELFPVTSFGNYLVDLFSLPPPTDEEHDAGLSQSLAVSLPQPRNSGQQVDPRDWTTWLTVRSFATESKIEVKFGFPEKESKAQFSLYRVKLVTPLFKLVAITNISYKPSDENAGAFNFTKVRSGMYRVQVTPIDDPRREHCLCSTDNGLFKNCESCKTSVSPSFNFTSIPPTTSAPFLTSTVSNTVQAENDANPLKSHQSTSENNNSDVILPAVLIPEAFLVVAALVMAIYCWKKPKKIGKTCKKNDQHDDDKSQFREVFRKMETFAHRTTREWKVPQVTRKTVLLLASEDHKYFSQALNNFSTFLTLHCQCDVMFAPEQLADFRKTANSYCWLSGKIDQADVVIIVTSEAACRLYQAFQNGMVYKEADLGPEGDLFTPGIKHICGKIASGEDVSKVMMVRFAHTLTDHRLPISALSPCFYLLPDRLKSFLLHIHELDENSMNLSKVNLPLCQGNVKELQGGREWLAAVSESRAFERQHPAWFEEKFRTPVDMSDKGKPTFRTQFSVRSQESGFFDGINPDILHRRLSSVSIIAEEALSGFVPDGLDNPSFVFSKSDFIAPSEVEVNSACTVKYSDYTEAESPSEVDQRSTLSDQFRMVNERFEQDRMRELFQQQELESMPPGEKSAVSDSTDCPHECQDPANPQQDVYSVEIHGPESWRGLDCISVSSQGWI